MDCSKHKGHRHYIGGRMDGDVAHLTDAGPSNYPQVLSTTLNQGQRSWYEIDSEASAGTEAVYRHIGDSRERPRQRGEEAGSGA